MALNFFFLVPISKIEVNNVVFASILEIGWRSFKKLLW